MQYVGLALPRNWALSVARNFFVLPIIQHHGGSLECVLTDREDERDLVGVPIVGSAERHVDAEGVSSPDDQPLRLVLIAPVVPSVQPGIQLHLLRTKRAAP